MTRKTGNINGERDRMGDEGEVEREMCYDTYKGEREK